MRLAHNPNCYYVRVSIANCNKLILERIKKIYGGYLYEEKRPKHEWKNKYELTITSRDNILKLFNDIKPYVILKRKQMNLAIKLMKINSLPIKHKFKVYNRYEKIWNNDIVKQKEDLFISMKQLNIKGKGILFENWYRNFKSNCVSKFIPIGAKV